MKSILRKIITEILKWEATLVLKKYKPKIIAVTGSVGKTSTKDTIFTVVEKGLVARKSVKSFNSEIGLPLTILGQDNGWSNPFAWLETLSKGLLLGLFREHYPKWLVLEIGADKPGDIRDATKWVKPNVAVITRFGEVPVHVEFFKSPNEVFEEKAELVKALQPTGMLIVNADDERVLGLRERTKAKSITYGFSPEAMFRASNAEIAYTDGRPTGMIFKFEYDGNVFPVTMNGILGIQPIYSALAALALGVYLKQNIIEMIGALAAHESPPGRMRVIEGLKGSTIIDDTYNASPVAAEAAVDVFDAIKTKPKAKKIAVLGDMMELGKFTVEEHKKLGKRVSEKADIILAVGLRAKYIIEGALDGDMSEKNLIEFADSRTAGKYLESILSKGDIVLVKGSQSVRMERVVEEVMAHPEDAGKLLVRQEEEWKAKV